MSAACLEMGDWWIGYLLGPYEVWGKLFKRPGEKARCSTLIYDHIDDLSGHFSKWTKSGGSELIIGHPTPFPTATKFCTAVGGQQGCSKVAFERERWKLRFEGGSLHVLKIHVCSQVSSPGKRCQKAANRTQTDRSTADRLNDFDSRHTLLSGYPDI